MHNLYLAICFSVMVSVLLKIARKQGVVIAQAVAFNYVVASSLTYFLLKPNYPAGIENFIFNDSSLPLFLALGILLPSVFLILAKAIELTGIVRTDVAQRFSLFLPILWAFMFFGQTLTINKGIGLSLGLVALGLILAKDSVDKILSHKGMLYLIGVWCGFGVIDILFKQVAKQGASFSNTLFATFILAGLLMFTYLTLTRTRWQVKGMLIGLLLGALNFGNIYFYIQAHQVFKHDPALVFASMNIGVIVLASIIGVFFFKEKISKINAFGIVLGMGAIVVLNYFS